MKIKTLVEVLTAAHLTYLVESPKEFSARGGMMFVAPVGHLKTVVVKTLDLYQPHSQVHSDLTIRQLTNMREEVSQGKVRTVAFMEFPKLYSRNADTSSNTEGALQQMADEGFRHASFEDQSTVVKEAHAFVVGAMPPRFYQRKWDEWRAGGFARRFLWCHFQLANPEVILDSIDRWNPLDLGNLMLVVPAQGRIPFTVGQQESTFIREILKHTKSSYEAVPFLLLKKICAVLKWRYADLGTNTARGKAIEILGDFGECLKGIAEVQLDLPIVEPHAKPAASARR
jgi:hypothetical protein